jgi:hypothetical protein
LLGLMGQWASVYWARRTRWQNLDEVLRAFGTILVSTGMLILLYQPAESVWNTVATVLLVDALLCFVAAFIIGRRPERARRKHAEAMERAAPMSTDFPAKPEVSPDTSSEVVRPHRS